MSLFEVGVEARVEPAIAELATVELASIKMTSVESDGFEFTLTHVLVSPLALASCKAIDVM